MRDESKYTEDEIELMFRKLVQKKLNFKTLAKSLDLPLEEVERAFNWSYSRGSTKHVLKTWLKGFKQ